MDLNLIKKLISKVIRWAVVESSVTDLAAYQTQTVSYHRRSGKSVSAYPWGYNALAPPGTLSTMQSISGKQDTRAHTPISGPERFRVLVGENVIGNPLTGAKIHFRNTGIVERFAPTSILETSPLFVGTYSSSFVVVSPSSMFTGVVLIAGGATITGVSLLNGNLQHIGTNAGFFGTLPITKPVVTGVKGANAALASIIAELANLGLITDSTT